MSNTMDRLLFMLEVSRDKPALRFLNRFAIFDIAQDVLIDAECRALCDVAKESVDTQIETETAFKHAKNYLGRD